MKTRHPKRRFGREYKSSPASRRAAAEIYRDQRARGLCAQGRCPDQPSAGHTFCESHLEQLRKRAKERSARRVAAGLCVECGKRSELGQQRCLTCRKVTEGSTRLPNPVARGLRMFRGECAQRQTQAERDARAKTYREFIERHLHLVAPRSQEILKLRYGATYAESHTLEEVGQIYGVTRERVRQIQQDAEDLICMLTIEKNVPIVPPGERDLGAEIKDTFDAMQPGDSFLLDAPTRIINNIRKLAHRRGFLITTRKTGENQVRIWLVSKQQDKVEEAA